jgi:hypothetical protein
MGLFVRPNLAVPFLERIDLALLLFGQRLPRIQPRTGPGGFTRSFRPFRLIGGGAA